MAEKLRPLTLGELLDRAIQLYRRHFGLFVGIAAAPYLGLLVIQLIPRVLGVYTPATARPNPLALATMAPALTLWFLGLEVAAIVALAYAMGATVWAVSRLHLGESTSIGRSLGEMKAHVAGVAFTMIAVGVVSVLPIIVIAGLLFLTPGLRAMGGGAALATGLVAFLLMIAAVVWAVWSWLRLAIAVPALVLEDLGLIAALRRSAALTKGYLGRVFLLYLLTMALEFALAGVFAVMALLVGGVHHPAMGVWAAWGVGTGFLVNVLVMPILTIGLALLFFDCKVRKEAFDIEVLLRRDAASTSA